MKKPVGLVVSSCLLAGAALVQTPNAQTLPLLFQTTFNCADWNQHLGLADGNVCAIGDGIAGSGGWTTASGSVDQITAAANNPAGGGGKGFRHWRGDGSNNCGGGLQITLPKGVTEMWVRFYQRYQQGFGFSPGGQPVYTKDNYWGSCGSGCLIFGIQGNHSWGVNYNGSTNYSSSLTWAASQGGSTGDGRWHSYEYHVKQNGTAGTIEVWVDGVRYLHTTSANLGSTPWTSFKLGENQATVAGCSGDCYTDYDDLAISTTGYIGQTAGGTTVNPPAAPLNVRIIR